jgi:uncharacterized membrane protein YdbT with pleckstrin-like domain
MLYNWTTLLAPEETVENEFVVSNTYRLLSLIALLAGGIFTMFVVIYAGILIVLLGILYWFYLGKAKHYAFTKKRVILVESFFGTTVTSVDYAQITDITIDQNAFDQIGGWGTILISTAGTNTPQIRLSFIDNPLQVKQQLDTIRDASSAPATLHQAQQV